MISRKVPHTLRRGAEVSGTCSRIIVASDLQTLILNQIKMTLERFT